MVHTSSSMYTSSRTSACEFPKRITVLLPKSWLINSYSSHESIKNYLGFLGRSMAVNNFLNRRHLKDEETVGKVVQVFMERQSAILLPSMSFHTIHKEIRHWQHSNLIALISVIDFHLFR